MQNWSLPPATQIFPSYLPKTFHLSPLGGKKKKQTDEEFLTGISPNGCSSAYDRQALFNTMVMTYLLHMAQPFLLWLCL